MMKKSNWFDWIFSLIAKSFIFHCFNFFLLRHRPNCRPSRIKLSPEPTQKTGEAGVDKVSLSLSLFIRNIIGKALAPSRLLSVTQETKLWKNV